MRPQAFILLALGVATAAATAGPQRLTEPAIRAFLVGQEAAWNRGDAGAWAATHAPDATFVDQARNSQGGITANGSSNLATAAKQARRVFSRAKLRQTSVIDRVEIAPDGRTARVLSHAATRFEPKGQPPRTLCAQSLETVMLAGHRIQSRGQVDTAVRCPR